ncbi:hypothetical protein [Aliiroseovarius subalbicans]|uniref:LIC10280 family protein n=1 Tax=Aliiroseovarius subalbicans TaxID=2925840 RepID=UPI001F58D0FF|nr:hypothetical protein [Aliiroseovarius subalbicans]MCI2400378.1 hypothetical protein [Aliiroseovarius subalbicans]
MFRRSFLAATFAFAATATAQVFPADITGTYTAFGMNPNGSTYKGRVRIEQSDTGQVAFAWQVGNSTYAGQGVREDRVVTIDWGQKDPVVYVIMDSGELHGTWAGGKALERLVRE